MSKKVSATRIAGLSDTKIAGQMRRLKALRKVEPPLDVPPSDLQPFIRKVEKGEPLGWPEAASFLRAYLARPVAERGDLQKHLRSAMMRGQLITRDVRPPTSLPGLLHQLTAGACPNSYRGLDDFRIYLEAGRQRIEAERSRLPSADVSAQAKKDENLAKIAARQREVRTVQELVDRAEGLGTFTQTLELRREGSALDAEQTVDLLARYGDLPLDRQRLLRDRLRAAAQRGQDFSGFRSRAWLNPTEKTIASLSGAKAEALGSPRVQRAMADAERHVTIDDWGAGLEAGICAGGVVLPVSFKATGGAQVGPEAEKGREKDAFVSSTLDVPLRGFRPVLSTNGWDVEQIFKAPGGLLMSKGDPLDPGKVGWCLPFFALRVSNNGRAQVTIEPPLINPVVPAAAALFPWVRGSIGLTVQTPYLAPISEAAGKGIEAASRGLWAAGVGARKLGRRLRAR